MMKDMDKRAAFEAVMAGDELGAAIVMDDMTPDDLHELMRIGLIMTGMARHSIISPSRQSVVESGTRIAHQIIDRMDDLDA